MLPLRPEFRALVRNSGFLVGSASLDPTLVITMEQERHGPEGVRILGEDSFIFQMGEMNEMGENFS